ncbi:MAG: DUF2281 domain-containing protein [candidate division KSB1 bacterium]|nr:DUF2281 domain-containing protein [candidate division KSB1 bacterium]MDZ7313933.1 DUF2281 domain-containing protein [candidate division KSB1 bacterium]
MTTVDKINQYVQKLPEPFQNEILHFVEFLMLKAANGDSRQADLLWSHFSLAEAMRGLENEDSPSYDESDLKEKWQ